MGCCPHIYLTDVEVSRSKRGYSAPTSSDARLQVWQKELLERERGSLTTRSRDTITNLPDSRSLPRRFSLRRHTSTLVASFGLLSLAACVPTAPPTSPSCSSDCSRQYEAAMTACEMAPQDPTGVNSIQSCMDTAQRSYGSCQAKCTASSIE